MTADHSCPRKIGPKQINKNKRRTLDSVTRFLISAQVRFDQWRKTRKPLTACYLLGAVCVGRRLEVIRPLLSPITQRHGNQQRPAGFASNAIDGLRWRTCLSKLATHRCAGGFFLDRKSTRLNSSH